MRRGSAGATVAGLFVATLLVLGSSDAAFHTSTASTGNTVGAGTLVGPSTLSTNPSSLLCRITVSWSTATTSDWATGYRLHRASSASGPFNEIATITPRSATSYADSDSSLRAGRTYHYQLRAALTGSSWLSSPSATASATAGAACL